MCCCVSLLIGSLEVVGLNSELWAFFRMENIWLLIQSGVPATTAPALLLSAAARRKNKPMPETDFGRDCCAFDAKERKAGGKGRIIPRVILQKESKVQRHS